jgi:hypothetical protein
MRAFIISTLDAGGMSGFPATVAPGLPGRLKLHHWQSASWQAPVNAAGDARNQPRGEGNLPVLDGSSSQACVPDGPIPLPA